MKNHTVETPPWAWKPNGGEPKGRQTPSQGLLNYTITNLLQKNRQQEEIAVMVAPLLESVVRALQLLSPRSQEMIATLVRQLAEREGISMAINSVRGLQTPAEGIPLWIAKLKQEAYSRQTIHSYQMTVQNYLKQDPIPTRLSIQRWLAERMGKVSTARVSNDRKALRSLFCFLHTKGLWPNDPTIGLKHIKVRYRARELPEASGITKLVQYKCYRAAETSKFTVMVLLLVTTGLRLSEAASILKKNINLNTREIRVIGKGGKEGIVPLLPMTADALAKYMQKQEDNSPCLFPGNTELGYYSIASFERTFRRACAKLGIQRLSPQQLRHYFATYALKGGAKLDVISKILRHASVAITADIYRHVLTAELHETIEQYAPFSRASLKLAAIFGSISNPERNR